MFFISSFPFPPRSTKLVEFEGSSPVLVHELPFSPLHVWMPFISILESFFPAVPFPFFRGPHSDRPPLHVQVFFFSAAFESRLRLFLRRFAPQGSLPPALFSTPAKLQILILFLLLVIQFRPALSPLPRFTNIFPYPIPRLSPRPICSLVILFFFFFDIVSLSCEY